MATYHHAFQINKAAYFKALEPLEGLRNEELLAQLAKCGAEIATRFAEHGFLIAIRQDPDWFAADIEELETGPLLLVQMVPYLVPAHALSANCVSSVLASISNEPCANEMHHALRSCVFGDSISEFFAGTFWYEIVRRERFLDHCCGWLAPRRCKNLLDYLESSPSCRRDVLPELRQLLTPDVGQEPGPLVLALET